MHLVGELLDDLARVVLAGAGLRKRNEVEVGECVARTEELASREVGEQGQGAGEGEDAIRAVGSL